MVLVGTLGNVSHACEAIPQTCTTPSRLVRIPIWSFSLVTLVLLAKGRMMAVAAYLVKMVADLRPGLMMVGWDARNESGHAYMRMRFGLVSDLRSLA